jgi:DNA-binding XRE family transcriptional regulator
MKTTKWSDLKHKGTAAMHAKVDADAVAELERVGFAALRKARNQTQVELAAKLGLPQASISDMENRSDLLLSTLAKYLRAMGGELQIRAVFPEASFDLEPPAGVQTKRSARAKR